MTGLQIVLEPLRAFGGQLAAFIPQACLAVVIVLAGWLIAVLCRNLLVGLLRVIGLERLSEKAKLSEVLHRGAVRFTFTELLGELAYWLVVIATVTVALQAVGMTAAAAWLENLGAFIPRIIISIVALLFGMLLASFLGAAVRAATLNAGFPHGHLLGQAVYTIVALLTVIIALEQLQVVTRTIEAVVYIVLGTFGLAFAIALGLGAQEFVKRFLSDIVWERWKSSQR